MIIQEREKNILAILSVVIIFVIYLYVLKPSWDEHEKLDTQIKALQSQLREPGINREKLEEMIEKVNLAKKDIDVLKNQLPLSEKRGFLVRDLEQLAKENSIEIISFMPKDATAITIAGKEIQNNKKTYSRKKHQQLEEQHAMVLKTIINIESRGKFANYSKFFSDIITYYRAVEVSNLAITRGGVAGQMSVDKRFAGARKQASPLEEAQNMDLSVAFTLIAYTTIPEEAMQNITGTNANGSAATTEKKVIRQEVEG